MASPSITGFEHHQQGTELWFNDAASSTPPVEDEHAIDDESTSDEDPTNELTSDDEDAIDEPADDESNTDDEEYEAMVQEFNRMKVFVDAQRAEITAILLLAKKITENPVALRTGAELAGMPTALVHPVKIVERELAQETLENAEQILASEGYQKLVAYCQRNGKPTPEEEAELQAPGTTLLGAMNGLLQARRVLSAACDFLDNTNGGNNASNDMPMAGQLATVGA